MSTESDMNAVVARWRRNVKGKFRGIASFEERAELRFNALKQRVYQHRVRADNWEIRQARYKGWGEYEFVDADWRPFRVGHLWGGEDMSAFFRQDVTLPPEHDGRTVALQVFFGGDSLLKVNGRPFHGLDIFRNEVILTPRARAGETLKLEVESYMNFGGSSAKENDLIASDLVAVDTDLRDAYWDLWCAAKALQIPELDGRLRDVIEFNLWEAMKGIPLEDVAPAEFRARALEAGRRVRETVYATDGFRVEGRMDLVGHSHIDVVFMWPYKEFIRKIGRTHATMLRLMEQYPEFRFSQSQAKIYADLKTYHPELFEQIRHRVAEGRWELLGAFWVEPDCNLISGESFVRQILHGQRFFRENFGRTARLCWQPDVFGLSWAMPQILARCGIEAFISNKMVPWNDTNPWTMNTFWWEGFDGTRMLAIVPPGHFIGTVDPDVIDKQWRAFSDRAEVGETLHVYGWGDGGGGVDPEMIESGKRYRSFPGLPALEFSSCEDAVDRIAAKARAARLPALRDEIYLEAHRGTYTHKARLKKFNRRAEFLYRDAEMLATFAWLNGDAYPEAELDGGWKELLTSQFHDSLPGTHVPQAYADLLAVHERIRAIGTAVRDRALDALAAPAADAADALLLFNSLPCARAGIASATEEGLAGRLVADGDGRTLPQQTVVDLEGGRRRLFRAPTVPSVGFRVLPLTGSDRTATPAGALSAAADGSGGAVLENERLKAVFDARGEMVSLFDKDAARDVLPAGETGNRFQLFEDTPGRYDAWDIVETYQDHPVAIGGAAKLSVDETGPLRASLRLERPCLASKIVQRISLCAGERQIAFETRIEWVERQRLLKVAFPADINAGFATYDIAFGNLPRPTHANTSWDRAKFEVPAHLWMDLSQHDYGVSVLNDCKYGCDVHGHTLRLTLLKGSIYPDPRADMETHHFTYALYPHAGDWRRGATHRAALEFNQPMPARLVRASGAARADGVSLLGCDAENLSLEAVKRSEDGKDLIARLVDRNNAAADARLAFARPARRAWACDLTERPERELPVENGAVRVRGRPYEILTVRVTFE